MDRVRYVLAAVSVAVGIVLLFQPMPFWWMGGGAILAGGLSALWTGRRAVRAWWSDLGETREWLGLEVTPRTVLLEGLAVATLFGLTVAMMPQVFLGDRPVSHDHTVHFFKAWQLEHTFLADGQIWGWSHEWFGGYPAQYLYPIGADLLVVAIHLLSFGFLDFGHAYAWAIFLFWFLGGYACYRFGARGFGRWVGLVAGLLFMTDNAANRIGGWYFAMEWGVWPMSLAVVLGIWSMAHVPRLMEGDRWREVGIFGLLMGASLLTHPFMVIHYGLAIPIALLAHWLAQTERSFPVAAGRLGVGAVVGGCIGALWTLPFVASSSYMDPGFGGRWTSMLELGHGIYNLGFLPGTWSAVTALGVIGMVFLLWHRGVHHLMVGISTVGFIVFGASDFVAGFQLYDYVEGLQRVHLKRMITVLKPYFIVAAAYALVAVARETASQGMSFLEEAGEDSEAQPVFRRWMRVFLIGMCLLPLLVPFGHRFGSKHVNHDLKNASERPHLQARKALASWFQEKYPDGKPFFRIGMKLRRHDHRFVDLGRRLPFPVYKFGYMPATSFVFRPETGDPELLEALNVRYVVSLRGRPSGEFEHVENFGALDLYEFQNWDRDPFEIVEGEGEVEVESFGREEIVLRAGEGASGRLRLSVFNFMRWRATRDGEPVEIDETTVAGNEDTGFITVDLEPGTYRFTFERSWTEFGAFVLGLVGLLLALLFVLADGGGRRRAAIRGRLEQWQARLRNFYARHRTVATHVGTGIGAGFVAVGATMAWCSPEVDVPDPSLADEVVDVEYDFADRLRDATVRLDKGVGSKHCPNMLGRFVCGSKSWQVIQTRIEDFGPDLSMKRCIWSHPRREGPIEISFRDVPSGDALVGFFGVPESGSTSSKDPVKLAVGVEGISRFEGRAERKETLYPIRAEVPEDARSGPIDVQFRVSADHTGKRHFCFNAQVVDLKEGASP